MPMHGREVAAAHTDAMDVVLRLVGECQVDNVGKLLDVDPSGCNISRNEEPAFTFLESLQVCPAFAVLTHSRQDAARILVQIDFCPCSSAQIRKSDILKTKLYRVAA